MKSGPFFIVMVSLLVLTGSHGWSAVDAAGQEAAGIVAGIQKASGARLMYNPKTLRLEVRDDLGNLLEEMPAGTVSRTVDAAGQEYRISFGKDELGRPSAIVRPGPAMRKPLLVEVFGRKAVLSPNASLLATMAEERQVLYEPSICGEVYYIEEYGGLGNKVSRLATQKREVARLAEPSYPMGVLPPNAGGDERNFEGMKQAGDAVRTAVFAVFGLPDKQPTPKAKVYRLKGTGNSSSGSAANPQDPMAK